MDPSIKRFDVDSFDRHCLLSVKAKLSHQGLMDAYLKKNLDFSIQAMGALPTPRRSDAGLYVDGDKFLLVITTGMPITIYTVYMSPDGPALHQKIKSESQLTPSTLSDRHFAGHQCRDEIENCKKQAQKALSNYEKTLLGSLELKITCGELHLTFCTKNPIHTIHIKPRRRVYMGEALSVEKILETKTRMEKSGEMGKGLLACFQKLLTSSESGWYVNYRFILQGDGEMVEFVVGDANEIQSEHFIYTDVDNKAQKC